MSETKKLLGSTKNKIIKYENVENVSHLKITEVALAHYNIVSNDYQHHSRALYKSFGQLLDVSPKIFIF